MTASAAARKQKPASDVRVSRVINVPVKTRGRPFEKNNAGRPKGAKNKVTKLQLEAARQAFTPMAQMGLDIGAKHLKGCEMDGCGACQWWSKVAFEYAYGKPTQPIEFDAVALRTELESIAVAAGKSVQEIEQEAREAGLRVMGDYAAVGA